MSKKQKKPAAWRNRIVGHGEVNPEDLLANPLNWRIHPKAQQDALTGVLEEVGWVQSVVVNQATGFVIDGHLRVSLALRQEEPTIPVVYVDLTPEEEAEVLATLDPIGAMAATDAAKLDELLQDVQSGSAAVQAMIAELAEKAGCDYGQDEPADAEPQVDRAAELQAVWQVQPGDLWQIGAHRLLCGDSTKAADVARVMGGEKAALMVTDPPYGVAYADKNAFLNAIGRPNSVEEEIEGDHQTPEEMSTFWILAFSTVRGFVADGGAYYVTGPQGGDLLLLLLLALRESGFPLRHMLVWAKNQLVIGRSDYHYKHEPIIYGWVDGAGHKFYGGRGECSLWEIDKPHASKMHPTMKPVELFYRAIGNSSQTDEIVIDPFLGSGTTLVACQNLGRHGRGIEIEPKYCAVALQRMQDAFPGIEIKRLT